MYFRPKTDAVLHIDPYLSFKKVGIFLPPFPPAFVPPAHKFFDIFRALVLRLHIDPYLRLCLGWKVASWGKWRDQDAIHRQRIGRCTPCVQTYPDFHLNFSGSASPMDRQLRVSPRVTVEKLILKASLKCIEATGSWRSLFRATLHTQEPNTWRETHGARRIYSQSWEN